MLRPGTDGITASSLRLVVLQRHCPKRGMFTMTASTTAAELVGQKVRVTSRAHHLARWAGLHGCATAVAPDGRVVVDIVVGRVSCDAAALDVVSEPSRRSQPR